MLAAGGVMAGIYAWERYMLRVRVLEEWQTIFIEIAGEINYSAESMSQICSRIENMSVYGKKFWVEMRSLFHLMQLMKLALMFLLIVLRIPILRELLLML